jgi:hypothetical protein
VGGLLTDQFVPKTSPSAQFNLADQAGSFDLKDFAVFDIIDLPVRVPCSPFYAPAKNY